MKSCGVYQIRNLVNGTVYIGQSINIEKRFSQHLSSLRSGKTNNKYFQRAYDKYGEENFVFEILKLCEQGELVKYENYFINNSKSVYNIRPSAETNKGIKRTKETRILLSKIHKGKTISQETRKRMSESRMGEKNHNYGKHLSKITKQKISDTFKRNGHPSAGRIVTKETKEKISAKNSGDGNGNFGTLWDATFCKKGHFLGKDNSYFFIKNNRTQRKCKTCHKERENRRKTIGIKCNFCGEEFFESKDRIARVNPKYCSKKCQYADIKGEKWHLLRNHAE